MRSLNCFVRFGLRNELTGPILQRRVAALLAAPFRRVALLTPALLLAACGSSSEPEPITCDAFERCHGSEITTNRLLCPNRIDDPSCGAAYRKWLECYSSNCSQDAAADAGQDPCDMVLEQWRLCSTSRDSEAATSTDPPRTPTAI
jgi:hypothetical protein